MTRALLPIAALAILTCGIQAQTVSTRPFINATGNGSVPVRPDQVQVTVGVITQGDTAQAASDQNATSVNNVLGALRQLLGQNADIKTTGYSISPIYKSNPGTGTSTLAGYTATYTIQATSGDLSMAGKIIDAATQAGANNVGGLSFGLKDPEPARAQALRAAAAQARAHAEAIAGGLGVHTGSVLAAQEGSSVRPLQLVDTRAGTAATSTTVVPGMLEVSATVTLEVELVP